GYWLVLPPLLHDVVLLVQNVDVTVIVLPITFVCDALSDWITTQPDRTIAPTTTAAAMRANLRRRWTALRRCEGLACKLTLFSFFGGPRRSVSRPLDGSFY